MRIILMMLGLISFGSAYGADNGSELIFAVNEGVTYHIARHEIRERFRPLTGLLAKELKRPIRIEPIDDYPELRAGLDQQVYDLALVHPAHHALKSINDQKYVSLGSIKEFATYRATFMVEKSSPLKGPDDLKGQKIGMPDPDSITAVMTRATLRDMGIDPKQTLYRTTRYQDAVPYMIEWGYVRVGTTGSEAVVKQWQDKGNKVLLKSKPVPIKHFIASTKLSEADRDKIFQIIHSLDATPAGQKILESLGYHGFVKLPAEQIAALTEWLDIAAIGSKR